MTRRREVALGSLLRIQNGFAFPSENFNGDGCGEPIIRIRDLKSGDTQTYFNGDFREEFRVMPGDLLIGMDGDFECVKWTGRPALLNQRVCRLEITSDKVERDFIFYAINEHLRSINARTAFATVKHLSSKQISAIELGLPPLSEQRRIVEVMQRAGGIVRLRQAALAKARETIPALFLKMFGDPATNPMGWPTHTFGDLVADGLLGLVRAASEMAPEHPVAYLRMNALAGDGRVDLSDMRRVVASDTEVARYALRRGDLLFNTRNSRELVGKTGVFRGASEPIIFNNNLLRLRFDRRMRSEVANAYFQTGKIRGELDAMKSGTTSVFAIYWKNLARLRLPLPPLGLQAVFEDRLNALLGIITQQERALVAAKQMEAALLARLLD